MKKMFLSSAFNEVSDQLAEFIGSELTGLTVTFINTASMTEDYTAYVDEAMVTFKEMGVEVELLDVRFKSGEEAATIIEKNDLIYIAGGNTFFLLQELKRKALDEVIRQAIIRGKVYIGESAGSVIMAPSIEYIQYMDDKVVATELTDYTGLNLLETFPVPHVENDYLNEFAEKIRTIYQDTLLLTPLKDNQVMLINGDDLTIK